MRGTYYTRTRGTNSVTEGCEKYHSTTQPQYSPSTISLPSLPSPTPPLLQPLPLHHPNPNHTKPSYSSHPHPHDTPCPPDTSSEASTPTDSQHRPRSPSPSYPTARGNQSSITSQKRGGGEGGYAHVNATAANYLTRGVAGVA